MCRCAQRRALIGQSVAALVLGDRHALTDAVGAIGRTIGSDAADLARAAKQGTQNRLASAHRRLRAR